MSDENENREIEGSASRQYAATKAGAYALAAWKLGLPIGEMALVMDEAGRTCLSSTVHDDIIATLTYTEPVHVAPICLLAKYVMLLIAGRAAAYGSDDAYCIQRALYFITQNVTRTPSEMGEAQVELFVADWFRKIEIGAKHLIKDNAVAINSVATALLESGTLSDDEIEQLLASSPAKAKAATHGIARTSSRDTISRRRPVWKTVTFARDRKGRFYFRWHDNKSDAASE